MKRRFFCLYFGFCILLEKVCIIVLVCVVLYNIGIDRNDILDVDEECINYGDMSFDVID